ncbi:hypothetical protein D3C81_303320 [compost metagenome]
MDDGKPSGPLETKAASVTLPICHLHVHRPLLAGFCLLEPADCHFSRSVRTVLSQIAGVRELSHHAACSDTR